MSGSRFRARIRAVYAGFAVFGSLWGAWGASLPAVRAQAHLSDGELGTALLFVGAGALPAMPLAGRAVDRWGQPVTAVLLLLLGGAGVAVAVTARDLVSLSAGLAVLGASSGAADVAINSAAGSAERAAARPVITRAHGVFSAAVVLASLSTGLLRGGGAPVATPFLLVALASVPAGIGVLAAARATTSVPQTADSGTPPERRSAMTLRMPPLLLVGGLGALAFAVENAHQSWTAVYLGDVLSAPPAIAAAGPAVFAAVVASARFAVNALSSAHPIVALVAGAAAAAAGTAVVATATTVPMALIGLALAAAGTAVLFPTLLSLVTTRVDDAARGAATSVVTTVAYAGFLAGPVYVGRWAAAVGLRGAMLAVAGVATALALLAWPTLRALNAGPDRWTKPGNRTGGAVTSHGRQGRNEELDTDSHSR
jgi:MFS family permease